MEALQTETFDNQMGDYSYRVLTKTWLTRSPRANSFRVVGLMTLLLVLGSFAIDSGWFAEKTKFAASGVAVFGPAHETWRLFTTLFAHADLGHLLSNSYLFFVLGYFLYGYFGWAVFPTAALIGGVVTNYLVVPTYAPEVQLIGASGMVYWMGGAWLSLYFFLSKHKTFTMRLVRTIGVALLLFMPAESFEPSISYRTHLVGFLVGVTSGTLQYYAGRTMYLKAERYGVVVDRLEHDPQFAPAIETQSSTWIPTSIT